MELEKDTPEKVMEELRPLRKDLVVKAEEVSKELAATDLEKTQLNHLIAVCGEATCAEEINNYLRYQEARKIWPPGSAEKVIQQVAPVLDKLRAQGDAHRVAAWRLYAVFLARAFTYGRHSRPRQAQGQAGAHHDRRGQGR